MKVFLSHSKDDKAFVEQLADRLKTQNIKPWLFEEGVGYGHNFAAEIEDGLREADVTILVLSPSSVDSAWTKAEWTSQLNREIRESRVRLGTVLLRECNIPQLLQTKKWFDARTNPDGAIEEVVEWISRLREMQNIARSQAPEAFLDFEPRDFIGRGQYLYQLHELLVEKPGLALICGGPGAGKSVLATKFAWGAQGAFDVVIFQACGRRPVVEIARELCQRLGIAIPKADKEEESEQAIMNSLRTWLGGRRTLLILDDVWADEVAGFVPGPPVSILITSRTRHFPGISPTQTLEIENFSTEEVSQAFRVYLGEEETARHWESLQRLADRFERLPIAIMVAADLLRRQVGPVDDMAQKLRIERLRNEVHDVPALLQRAIEAQTEPDQRLLEAMAVCSEHRFELRRAAEMARLSSEESAKARDRLINAFLVRVVDRDRQLFRLHALVRQQLRQRTSFSSSFREILRNQGEIFVQHYNRLINDNFPRLRAQFGIRTGTRLGIAIHYRDTNGWVWYGLRDIMDDDRSVTFTSHDLFGYTARVVGLRLRKPIQGDSRFLVMDPRVHAEEHVYKRLMEIVNSGGLEETNSFALAIEKFVAIMKRYGKEIFRGDRAKNDFPFNCRDVRFAIQEHYAYNQI